ncbi:hypothetical protein ABZ135_16810 [Streptomyces sp. NPDC006339]|uniref:hypothetical protein n=1 Tax=Streptomyces sp. NPDC006339 TaxID=3156755 RepID=UPI0033BBA4D1
MLQNPENTVFVRAATPVLVLTEAPIHDALPALPALPELPAPASASADGEVPVCEGWGIVPRLTLCVVDGPGDHGTMIPALAAPVLGDGDLADWCEDAERAGGAIVVSLPTPLPPHLDLPALTRPGTSRGGFVPLLG